VSDMGAGAASRSPAMSSRVAVFADAAPSPAAAPPASASTMRAPRKSHRFDSWPHLGFPAYKRPARNHTDGRAPTVESEITRPAKPDPWNASCPLDDRTQLVLPSHCRPAACTFAVDLPLDPPATSTRMTAASVRRQTSTLSRHEPEIAPCRDHWRPSGTESAPPPPLRRFRSSISTVDRIRPGGGGHVRWTLNLETLAKRGLSRPIGLDRPLCDLFCAIGVPG